MDCYRANTAKSEKPKGASKSEPPVSNPFRIIANKDSRQDGKEGDGKGPDREVDRGSGTGEPKSASGPGSGK